MKKCPSLMIHVALAALVIALATFVANKASANDEPTAADACAAVADMSEQVIQGRYAGVEDSDALRFFVFEAWEEPLLPFAEVVKRAYKFPLLDDEEATADHFSLYIFFACLYEDV